MFLNSGIGDSVNLHMFIKGQVVSGHAKTLSFWNSQNHSSVGTHEFIWI